MFILLIDKGKGEQDDSLRFIIRFGCSARCSPLQCFRLVPWFCPDFNVQLLVGSVSVIKQLHQHFPQALKVRYVLQGRGVNLLASYGGFHFLLSFCESRLSASANRGNASYSHNTELPFGRTPFGRVCYKRRLSVA